MAHANAVQSRRNPRIERTKADAPLAPVDCTLGFPSPAQNQRAPRICPRCRWGNCKGGLERLLSQGTVMFDKTNRDCGINKRWSIVGAKRHCNMRVLYRGSAIVFTPSCSEIQYLIAKRRLAMRKRVVRLK